MVEKRDNIVEVSQKNNKKKIKATTGAWWKSTVEKEDNGKVENKKQLPDSTVSKVQEPSKAPAKRRRPRKRPSTSSRLPGKRRKGLKATSSPKDITSSRKTVSATKKVQPAPKESVKKDTPKVATLAQQPKRAATRHGRKRVLKRAWEKGKSVFLPLLAIIGGNDAVNSSVESGESKDLIAEKHSSLPSPKKGGGRKGPARPRRGKRGESTPKSSHQTTESKAKEKGTSAPVDTDVVEQKDTGPQPVLKLLVNAEEPEESRLALLENGRLESIHVSTVTRAHTKNNIYKAKIVAIEANLQAAFVDYGTDKNGFLPFSEIHPEYYKQDVSEKIQHLINTHQWKKLSITSVLERGQEVLVQVVKEEVGKKGANMTTYLSLPGRCVVLMPGSDSTGISRKIHGEERRGQLRESMKGMEVPEGIGWIVRTASIDITKTALSRDVTYLLRLWEEVKKKGQTLQGVGMVYQEQNSILRFLREHFDPAIQEILVDNETALEQVKDFISLLPSKQRSVKVKLHRGSRPIFNQYSVEDQIESIYQPTVNLPSGGSIVINPTEALVAIDVNSGSTSKGQNFEASIFQANMEAAKELARQLRLRDLGGLIVVDFIDMRSKKNIREVEKQVKVAMKMDKAKVDMSRISKFGLMQISRQKLGAPIEAGNYRVCEHCKGRGTVRSVETLALFYLRRIQTGASRKMVQQVECRFPLDVAQYLLNNKRQELRDLEVKYGTEVTILANPALRPADNEILFHKVEKTK